MTDATNRSIEAVRDSERQRVQDHDRAVRCGLCVTCHGTGHVEVSDHVYYAGARALQRHLNAYGGTTSVPCRACNGRGR